MIMSDPPYREQGNYRFVKVKFDPKSIKTFPVGVLGNRTLTEIQLSKKSTLGFRTLYFAGKIEPQMLENAKILLEDDQVYGLICIAGSKINTFAPSSLFEGRIEGCFKRAIPKMAVAGVLSSTIFYPEIFDYPLLVQALGFSAMTVFASVVYGTIRWNLFQEKHGTDKQLNQRCKKILDIYSSHLSYDL